MTDLAAPTTLRSDRQSSHRSRFVEPTLSLWFREVLRFARQRSRVAGVLISPLVFWLFLGLGFGRSFAPPTAEGMGYLEYFFPGTVLLIVLFTAIFSTISIIEDRREGFLQSVIVSPARPSAVALGKILGGTTVALAQGVLLLALARPAGIPLGLAQVLPALGVLFVIGFGLTGLGFLLAWRMDSTQGFHAIMNLLFVPMWMLSGAVFPIDGAPTWLAWLMTLNPLSHGLEAFRAAMYPTRPVAGPLPAWLSLVIAVLFALCMWGLSARVAGAPEVTARRRRARRR